MLKQLLSNPFFRFIFRSSGIYLIWYFLYEFYLKEHSGFDEWVIDSACRIADGILSASGFQVMDFGDGVFHHHVGIAGSKGVTIGAPCDGIVLFALFTVFIISFPGTWKHRLWYIPSGIFLLHLMNALRISALAWIMYYNESWLQFNHDYTFTIIVYAIVFLLWYIWVKFFSTLKLSSNDEQVE